MKKFILIFLLFFSSLLFANDEKLEVATFAGGCFWCMEHPFEELDGVKDAISGYAGGKFENPTYDKVASGKTDQAESVQVSFNPKEISYAELLEVYWRQTDPTDPRGQFVDRGYQYRPAIFYHNEKQRLLAEKSKASLEKSGVFKKKIATLIQKIGKFYKAEEYHQDFYKKNKKSIKRYKSYRKGSGRDQYIKKVWDKHFKNKKILSEKDIKGTIGS